MIIQGWDYQAPIHSIQRAPCNGLFSPSRIFTLSPYLALKNVLDLSKYDPGLSPKIGGMGRHNITFQNDFRTFENYFHIQVPLSMYYYYPPFVYGKQVAGGL
jgi:hypothetical protein